MNWKVVDFSIGQRGYLSSCGRYKIINHGAGFMALKKIEQKIYGKKLMLFGDSLYHDSFGKPVYYNSFEEAAVAVYKYEEEKDE